MAALAVGAAARRAHASTTSTGRSSSSARSTTTASLALDRARELVAQYLGQQPHIMKASGVDESLLEEIGKVLTWPATPEQIEQAMELVPDEVVQLITASGTADECRAKVREYVDNGCTCPVLYPLGDDVPAMIDAFATVTRRDGGLRSPARSTRRSTLKAEHPEAVPVAGGTDLMVEVNFGRRRPPALLDLSRVAELKTWQRRRTAASSLGAGSDVRADRARARGVPSARRGVALGRLAADPEPRDDRRQPRHRLAGRRRLPVLAAYGADVVVASRGRRAVGCRGTSSSPGRSARRSRRTS